MRRNPSITRFERERVVQDLVNYWSEVQRVIEGNSVTERDVEDYEETLSEKGDDELLSQWKDEVGEWIEDKWGYSPHKQLKHLLSCGAVMYGYSEYEYEQPYEQAF